jgi:hypothetical protein
MFSFSVLDFFVKNNLSFQNILYFIHEVVILFYIL